MPHKFKIVERKGGQFGVQFLYNSEIMVWSESYKSKSSAQNCIESMKKNTPGAAIVDLTKDEEGSGYRWEIAGSKDGQFYNRFVASNGETMVRSETYTDKRNAIGCAESVSKNSPDAAVEDES